MCSSSGFSVSWRFDSRCEQDTVRLGTAIGKVVARGTVIGLAGGLGTGKTRLVRAVAEAMGAAAESVNSPTFVLIQEYPCSIPVYHFDTYRLRDSDEFLELGAAEILESDGVSLIEWADRVADVLPRDMLQIKIEIAGESQRVFVLSSSGPKSKQLLSQLKCRLGEPR